MAWESIGEIPRIDISIWILSVIQFPFFSMLSLCCICVVFGLLLNFGSLTPVTIICIDNSFTNFCSGANKISKFIFVVAADEEESGKVDADDLYLN